MAEKTIRENDESHVMIGIEDKGGMSLSMACPGDSGAPAYRQNLTSGELEVVGIIGARSKSSRSIRVDEKETLIVVNDKTNPPVFWINKLITTTTNEKTNPLGWLKGILPEDSFAQK